MKTTEFYKQSEICAKENGHQTIKPFSEVLACKKFGGECALIKCLNASNGTSIGRIL